MYFSLFLFYRWFLLEYVFMYISLMHRGEKLTFKSEKICWSLSKKDQKLIKRIYTK